MGALELALLPQLFGEGSAGDEGLDAKAVALSLVQVGQRDHIGLGDVLFLEHRGEELGVKRPAGVAQS